MAACRIIFESNAYVTKFFMGLSQKFSQQGTLNNSLIRQIIADRYEMSPRPVIQKVILANLIISDLKMTTRQHCSTYKKI